MIPNYLTIVITMYIVIILLYVVSSMKYIKKYKETQELGLLINDCLALYPYTNFGVIIFGLLSYILTLFIFTNCVLLLTSNQ